MNRRLAKFVPPALAAVMAAGLALQMGAYRTGDTTATAVFHARVKAAVDAIPMHIGSWEATTDKLPEAAGQLLRPNVTLCRTYHDPQQPWAKLIVIHCKDSRDMSGHYPPNCYRGSGWSQTGDPLIRQRQLWGRTVPIAEYGFTRSELRGPITWTIYDFFVLPLGGFVTSMSEIQKASGDYRTRPYGAAQIQVIMDAGTPEADRERILSAMLEPLGPVIDQLQNTREGARP